MLFSIIYFWVNNAVFNTQYFPRVILAQALIFNLDKLLIKMFLIPLNIQIYVLLPIKHPPEFELDKVSYETFYNEVKIMKKV